MLPCIRSLHDLISVLRVRRAQHHALHIRILQRVFEAANGELVFLREGRSLRFFFQAEDGIRLYKVTGVQTCALPISLRRAPATCVGDADGTDTFDPTVGWS